MISSLGLVSEEVGRPQDALHWYGLLESTVASTWALEQRARVEEAMGDTESARETWRQVVRNYTRGDSDNPRVIAAPDNLARLGG